MIDSFLLFFEYGFLVRAVIVGVLIAVCSGLLGVTLVLKRYSMIGDGLSHVSFGSICIAMALNISPLWISVPVVILSAFILLRINARSKISGDASIALISSTSIAVGVLATSFTTGFNTDVSGYMFGSIFTMTRNNVYMSIAIALVVIAVYAVLYKNIFAITFDESFSKAIGLKTGVINTVISLLTAATIVISMKIMGALLVSSLIIFPSLSAMRISKSYKNVVILSAVISSISFFIGIILSFMISAPAGATVVALSAVMFGLFTFAGKLKNKNNC